MCASYASMLVSYPHWCHQPSGWFQCPRWHQPRYWYQPFQIFKVHCSGLLSLTAWVYHFFTLEIAVGCTAIVPAKNGTATKPKVANKINSGREPTSASRPGPIAPPASRCPHRSAESQHHPRRCCMSSHCAEAEVSASPCFVKCQVYPAPANKHTRATRASTTGTFVPTSGKAPRIGKAGSGPKQYPKRWEWCPCRLRIPGRATKLPPMPIDSAP